MKKAKKKKKKKEEKITQKKKQPREKEINKEKNKETALEEKIKWGSLGNRENFLCQGGQKLPHGTQQKNGRTVEVKKRED